MAQRRFTAAGWAPSTYLHHILLQYIVIDNAITTTEFHVQKSPVHVIQQTTIYAPQKCSESQPGTVWLQLFVLSSEISGVKESCFRMISAVCSPISLRACSPLLVAYALNNMYNVKSYQSVPKLQNRLFILLPACYIQYSFKEKNCTPHMQIHQSIVSLIKILVV